MIANIYNNYKNIENEIKGLKRKEESLNSNNIKILCVSKTKPYEEMLVLKDNGINFFGENYVQEIVKKYEIDNTLKFHMIGHLQTNKVKYIIDKVNLIESVDSIKLAEVIQKEAEKRNIISNILIQVNLFCEDTKYGILLEDLEDMIKSISRLKNINICGIMTSSLYTTNPEENRMYFRKLKEKFDMLKDKYNNDENINLSILSMGMSNDYKIAIEEGATEVRLGTLIFGERH